MLGQVLDKLDAWVGKSFLLASLFPLLIFFAANALTLQFLTPTLAQHAADYFKGGTYGPINATVTCIAAAAAVAYVTDPFAAVMTRLLEGAYFPSSIAGLLATDQVRKVRALENAIQNAGILGGKLETYREELTRELSAADAEGVAIGAMRKPWLVAKAQRQIDALQSKRETLRPMDVDELKAAVGVLQEALKENCADVDRLADGATHKEKRYSRQLRQLFVAMRELVDYAFKKAASEYSLKLYEKEMNFPAIEAPTEFGNHSAALRGFFEQRFQMDFDFFWPIVQLVSQGDDKAMNVLTQIKQRLDFCIRILMYTIIFTAIWLAVGAFVAENELTVFLIGTGGLVFAALWLEIIQTSFRALSELMRSIVIVKRFDVLKQLHLPLPTTWTQEQQIWRQITEQLVWGSKIEIAYQHPDK
jgi:hypothetical protein